MENHIHYQKMEQWGDAVAVIDWDTVIANAQKHPDQSTTNNEIGIDMYGNPVNMDLWTYELDEENKTFATGKGMESKPQVGYVGDIVEGKIVGEIPQYIKKDNEKYTLTSLKRAFVNISSLTTAPTIPDSVTNMVQTFCSCTSLTGKLVINSNTVSILYECLYSATTKDGCNLVVSGTCPQLDDIIATKSSDSHITKGQ